jgi:hypothetical protein
VKRQIALAIPARARDSFTREDSEVTMRAASIVTALLLAALGGGPTVAGAAAQDGVAITGEPALRMLFVDQTFDGHTREGTAWTEYYWPDGRSSYKQDDCITPGH